MNELFTQRPIVRRPRTDLHIHSAVKDDPRLAKDDPRYLAMKSAWTESGLIPPLYITPDGGIVDGRHKFWFAEDMGVESLDCIEVQEEEVTTVILSSLAGRNHVSKGQRAFLVCRHLQSAFDAGRLRRLQILQSGGKTKLPAIASVEDLAEKHGVNPEYLRQAARLHEAFANAEKFDFSADGGGKKKLTLRDYFQPRILDAYEPMSLGDALKGVASKLSPNSKDSGAKSKAARNSHFARFLHGAKATGKVLDKWDKLDDAQRDEAAKVWTGAIAKAPDELLQLTLRAAKQELNARKKEGSEV